MTERRKASDFHPRILEIFDGYVHGRIGKRDFMVQAAQFATAGMTAAAIFERSSRTTPWPSRCRQTTPPSRPRPQAMTAPRAMAASAG